MSPLLIFLLVVLFLVGGLLVLRDTAFLRGKQKQAPGSQQRRIRRDHRNDDMPVLMSTETTRQTGRHPDHDHDQGSHDNASDSGGAGNGGSDGGSD